MNNNDDFWEAFGNEEIELNGLLHSASQPTKKIQDIAGSVSNEVEKNQNLQGNINRIVQSVGEYGTITDDINGLENVDRAFLWIKHLHSGPQCTKDFITHRPYATAFFHHQDSVLRLQQAICREATLSNVRFFLEGWNENKNIHTLTIETLHNDQTWLEEYMQKAKDNPTLALALFNELERYYNASPIEAQHAFAHFVGVHRFIKELILSNRFDSSRLHGLMFTSVHRQVVAAEEEQKEFDIKPMMNFLSTKLIEQTLGEGEIGIGILGANHFSSGFPIESSTLNLENSIESFARRSPDLRNTRIMIVEPYDFALTNKRFEESVIMQWNSKNLSSDECEEWNRKNIQNSDW